MSLFDSPRAAPCQVATEGYGNNVQVLRTLQGYTEPDAVGQAKSWKTADLASFPCASENVRLWGIESFSGMKKF